MKKERSLCAGFLAVLLLTIPSLAEEGRAKNLLLNPGFEEGFKNWEPERAGIKHHKIIIDEEEANTGKCSLKIGNWPGPYGAYWANSDSIPIDHSKIYKFSFFYKTTVGIEGQFYGKIACMDKADRRLKSDIRLNLGPQLKWKEVSNIIESSSFPEETAKVEVHLYVRAAGEEEYVWFDDVCFRKISDEEIKEEQKKSAKEFEVYLKEDLLRELLKRYSQFYYLADTYPYEFSEIAKKSKDPLLQEEALSVVKTCKEVMNGISDFPALTYEKTLYLFGKSSALLRDADKVRYKFLLEGLVN